MTETPRSSRSGALLVGTGIFLSRIFGLVRTRFQAEYLGADNSEADALFLALRLPNFLQNLLGEGALSAAFIPAYSGLLYAGERERAKKLSAAVFALLAFVVGVIVLVGIVLAPYVVSIFTMSDAWNDDSRALATTLVRIIFPGTGALVLSAWCLAVLNSHRRFLLSYAAPVIWNVCIIALIIYAGTGGAGRAEVAVWAAFGALLGSVLQLLVQLPTVLSLGAGISMSLRNRGSDLADVVRRFLPAVATRGSVQISAYIDTFMVNLINAAGSLSVLSYAQTLYQLPISLFGMSVAAAELPEISTATDGSFATSRDSPRAALLRERLGSTLRRAMYFAIPSAIALAVFGDRMVALLWQTGAFGDTDVRNTWVVLIGFAIGVIPATGGRIVATSFFAMRDTTTPFRFALMRIAIGAFLAATFMFVLPQVLSPDLMATRQLWRVAGLSLGGAIAFWLEFALLFSAFERLAGSPLRRRGFYPRIFLAVAIAVVAGLGVAALFPREVGNVGHLAVLGGFGVAYLAVTQAAGVAEFSLGAFFGRKR